MRRPAKKRSFLGRFILWSFLIMLVVVLGAGLYGYTWIRGYIQSEAFRAQLARQLGRAAKADATVDTLTWSGSDVHVAQASLTPRAAQGWKFIEAEGLQAALDFGAIRDGVWHVSRISADMVRMDMRNPAEIPQDIPLEVEEAEASHIPGWLRGWIPSRTKIDEVNVQTFDFTSPTGGSGVNASGLSIVAKPAQDEGAWLLRGAGGKLVLPGLREPLHLVATSVRLDTKAMAFNDAVARWLGDSEVTARGDVPFEKSKPWSFNGSVTNLDMKHLLSSEWNNKLSGVIEGDYQVSSALLNAKVRIKNGIAQNMAVLDRVAEFTHTERFRRIVFDAASANIERKGERTEVTNLILQSVGLIRVEGAFSMEAGQIKGEFLVGVAPDTLRWIPGSQSHVFTESRADAPGYVWTTVRIHGPISAPREDLSNRLLAAAGKALLLDTPIGVAEKGVEVLGKAAGGVGGVGGEAAKGVIETGTDVLKGTGKAAGKAVETGVDLLKGVVPIFGK